MDAIEFVKQLRRMNEQGVPKNRFIYPCAGQETDSPEEVVAEVEDWAKEHPAKTRQSVFLEQYPEAELDGCGVVTICPAPLSDDYRNSGGGCKHPSTACFECRRKFWLAEVEE